MAPDASEPTPEPTPAGNPADTPEAHPRRPVKKSRAGETWVGLVIAALLGIIVLIFILQNLDKVHVSLLFWDFSLPLGITVLLSWITGALVMALVGGVRIMQLRRAVKQHKPT